MPLAQAIGSAAFVAAAETGLLRYFFGRVRGSSHTHPAF